MKIAIGPYGGGSGISTYALELCRALSTLRTGLEVTLLTWHGFNPPNGEIRTLSLPKNAFLGMSDYFGGPLIKTLGASLEVRRKVNEFDLVHFPILPTELSSGILDLS